jgi:hypothetical protein
VDVADGVVRQRHRHRRRLFRLRSSISH